MRLRVAVFLAFSIAPAAANADVIADWVEAADRMGQDANPYHAYAASEEWRLDFTDSRVALAMFEAANAADPRYRSYLGLRPATESAAPEAAAAQAAHDVLVDTIPAQRAQLDSALAFCLAQVADFARRDAGIELGHAAARAVLARTMVGTGATFHYVAETRPGRYVQPWAPTIPEYTFSYRPWFLADVKAIAVPPPPAPGTERYARDHEKTRRLGGVKSPDRTPAQTGQALFWAQANDAMAPLRAIDQRPGRSVVQNARLYALAMMAEDDAGMSMAAWKLTHLAWRPVTAIRNGVRGPAAIAADPGWTPLMPTPPHPEYPCGHCTYAVALATVLEGEVGPHPADVVFVAKQSSRPEENVFGAGYAVSSWSAYVDQVNQSRIYAGAHFRYSTEAATVMARQIASIAIRNFAPPLR